MIERIAEEGNINIVSVEESATFTWVNQTAVFPEKFRSGRPTDIVEVTGYDGGVFTLFYSLPDDQQFTAWVWHSD